MNANAAPLDLGALITRLFAVGRNARRRGAWSAERGPSLLAFLLTLGLMAGSAWAQQPATQGVAFQANAEAILGTAYSADGPGAVAVVTRRGRVEFAGARGLADIASNRRLTVDTVFNLASITKQFVATAVLQLVAEGRISLDDPISRFYPDFPAPASGVTVRQLLNHTSGIQPYTSVREWMVPENFGAPHTTAEMIAITRDRPLRSPPGQTFAYNNSGYVILGGILERVTGRPWHSAIVESIGRPLGLTSLALGDATVANDRLARGYARSRDGLSQVPSPLVIHMSVAHASGGLVGSAPDLARWADALHHGRLLPPALYRQMVAPTRLPDGSTKDYGFGTDLDRVRGRTTYGHGGNIPGFVTETLYSPADDVFVVVLANSEDPATQPGIVARRLLALAVGDPYPTHSPAPADPAEVGRLQGTYRFASPLLPIRIFSQGGELYTTRGEERPQRVISAGGGRFYYADTLDWFEVRQDGGMTRLLFHATQNSEPDVGHRVSEAGSPD